MQLLFQAIFAVGRLPLGVAQGFFWIPSVTPFLSLMLATPSLVDTASRPSVTGWQLVKCSRHRHLDSTCIKFACFNIRSCSHLVLREGRVIIGRLPSAAPGPDKYRNQKLHTSMCRMSGGLAAGCTCMDCLHVLSDESEVGHMFMWSSDRSVKSCSDLQDQNLTQAL